MSGQYHIFFHKLQVSENTDHECNVTLQPLNDIFFLYLSHSKSLNDVFILYLLDKFKQFFS